jgi:hypothetical protein
MEVVIGCRHVKLHCGMKKIDVAAIPAARRG